MAKVKTQPLELEPTAPPVGDMGNARTRVASTAESDDYTPDVAAQVQRPAPPPRIDASPAFMFTHRPGRYTVMGGQVIPLLGKFKLMPGINGIDQEPKTGKPLPRDAIGELKESGVVVIPWDVQGPGTTYLRKPKGTQAVISQWERVYPGSNQVDCDVKGYVAFCRSLITKGLVPHPPVFVLERMDAELLKQIEDLVDKPAAASLLKRLQDDRTVLLAELEVQRRAEGALETEDFIPEEAA